MIETLSWRQLALEATLALSSVVLSLTYVFKYHPVEIPVADPLTREVLLLLISAASVVFATLGWAWVALRGLPLLMVGTLGLLARVLEVRKSA